MRCQACGQENPDGFRFCGACGAALETVTAAVREERKVVTVLFADLVGFTSRAEQMDPEDVRALLAPYHARLREELERFSGGSRSTPAKHSSPSAPVPRWARGWPRATSSTQPPVCRQPRR